MYYANQTVDAPDKALCSVNQRGTCQRGAAQPKRRE